MPIGPYANWEACIADQMKKKHSPEEAKKICGFLEKKAQAINYLSGIKPIEVEGKWYAEVEIMDAETNRAHWGASETGIQKALASLLEVPLLYLPGVDESPDYIEEEDPFFGGSHKGEWKKSGKPVLVSMKPDGSVHANYEVFSQKAIDDLKAKKVRAVSPSARIFESRLSQPRGTKEDPVLTLDDFDFTHVLLLPEGTEGAYPNAQVEHFWEDNANYSGFSSAVQAAYHGHSIVTELLRDDEADQTREGQKLENVNAAWPPSGAPSNYMDSPWQATDFAVHTDSVRKLPYKNPSSHSISPDGVRAALTRFHQTDFPPGTKDGALSKLCSAAKEVGIESSLCEAKGSQVGKTKEELELDEKEKQDYEAKLTLKDKDIADRDKTIADMKTMAAALETKIGEAGKELNTLVENKGLASMQARVDELIQERDKLALELENTRIHAAALDKHVVDMKVKEYADIKVEAKLLNPKDRPTFEIQWRKASVDELDKRLEEARAFAARLGKLGIKRETYGAGAALPTAQANRGLTVGSPFIDSSGWKRKEVD